MPLANLNIDIDQYADFFQTTYTWLTGPENGPYVPVDLTGAAAQMMIRQNPGDALPIVSISTTPNAQGYITLGGVTGTIQPVILKAVFPTLPTGALRFDLFINWPSGKTTDLAGGLSFVTPTSVH